MFSDVSSVPLCERIQRICTLGPEILMESRLLTDAFLVPRPSVHSRSQGVPLSCALRRALRNRSHHQCTSCCWQLSSSA